MSNNNKIIISLSFFLLSACTGTPVQTTPTPTPVPQPEQPSPSSEQTVMDVEPSLISLSVNGTEIYSVDGVFILPGEINPGNVLHMEVQIMDDEEGWIKILGGKQAYIPAEDNIAVLTLRVDVPANLLAAEITFSIGNEEALEEYRFEFEPGDEWPLVISIGENIEWYETKNDYSVQVDVSSLGEDHEILDFEQMLGLGDRYSGTEYVSSRQLSEFSFEDNSLIFRSEWPGNYRFNLVVADTDGDTTQTLDIPMSWKDANPFQIRSIAFGPFIPYPDLDYVPEILDRIAASGANFVDIQVPIHQSNLSSVTFLQCATVWSPDVPCHNYSDELLVRVIEMAHQRDLGVLLSLTLSISNFQENTFFLNPTNWSLWFENYTLAVNHYADIAEAQHVEILAIGNEMHRSHSKATLWNNLIDSVRIHYSGKLTYRDNSPVYAPESPFPSWDRLDYIGLNFWYAATQVDLHPSVEQMIDSFESQLINSFDPVVALYGKPVFVTEIGPDGYDGTNIDPPTTNCTAEIDNQENVDYVEAALIVAGRRKWVGINAWKIQPVRNPWSPEGCNIETDMRDTPLEAMFSLWFYEPATD